VASTQHSIQESLEQAFDFGRLRLLGRLDRGVQRNVAERVGAERAPDAVGLQRVGDQLGAGGAVQTVESRPLQGRRRGPDVHLEGTVRTYSQEARGTVERRMREILDGLTAAAGATYDIEYTGNAPATENDPGLEARVRPSQEAAVGSENVLDSQRLLVGEVFASFTRDVPGFYLRLGVEHPDHPSGGLHTPTFRGDDASIAVGMRAMAHLVWDYLESGGAAVGGGQEGAGAAP